MGGSLDNCESGEFVLPVENWDYILQNVTATEDIWSCSNTCRLWKDLMTRLHGNQETWMFPAVFPTLFEYLSTNDILECRRVCQKWCMSIDSTLERRQCSQFGTQSYRTIQPDFRSVAKANNLTYYQVLRRFEDDFSLHPRGNPFLSRSLFLYYPRTSERTLKFVEHFGKHLWSMSIHVSEYLQNAGGHQSVEYTQYLYKILAAVPHLRKLRIYAVTYMRRSERENRRLRQFLLENPPPPLPHLKSVHISVSHGALLQQAFEYAYSPQCSDICHSVVGLVSLSKMNLPNLKRLSLEIEYDNWGVQMTNLRNLRDHPPQELHVNLRNFNSYSSSTLKELFDALEYLKGSLIHLRILFGIGYTDGIMFPENLNLPRLKSLKLSNVVVQKHTSFDFLKSLESISKFTLEFSYNGKLGLEVMRFPELERNHTTLDFTLYLRKIFHSQKAKTSDILYKSNLWRLVPSLQNVTLHVQKNPKGSIGYTRQMYHSYVKNNLF